MINTKKEVEEKIKTEYRAGKIKEIKKFDPFVYPTDRFMKELTCAVFDNLYMEAGLESKAKCHREYRIEQLYEIMNFCATQNDFWWRCLQEFAPTIDRIKLRKKIKAKAEETIDKIKLDIRKHGRNFR